jgi:stage V sporulation protein D (sporulation-specific penicillin-binding protein)
MLRGTIFDRTERALAMSVKVKSLIRRPARNRRCRSDGERSRRAESKAERYFERFAGRKGKLIKDSSGWRETRRRRGEKSTKRSKTGFEKIRFAALRRLALAEEQKRSYPYKNLAAHIVGFSNADDVGKPESSSRRKKFCAARSSKNGKTATVSAEFTTNRRFGRASRRKTSF